VTRGLVGGRLEQRGGPWSGEELRPPRKVVDSTTARRLGLDVGGVLGRGTGAWCTPGLWVKGKRRSARGGLWLPGWYGPRSCRAFFSPSRRPMSAGRGEGGGHSGGGVWWRLVRRRARRCPISVG
jgi:hypothetical protein